MMEQSLLNELRSQQSGDPSVTEGGSDLMPLRSLKASLCVPTVVVSWIVFAVLKLQQILASDHDHEVTNRTTQALRNALRR